MKKTIVLLMIMIVTSSAAVAQSFTDDHGFVTDSTGATMLGPAPHVYKDTSGNWVMILQGFFPNDTWGCTSTPHDKIGIYTNNYSDPSSGWVRGQRIGDCDPPGEYRTHGVGSVIFDTNYNAPFYLSVDHGILTVPGISPDTEKHYIYLWESDNGRDWRNETLILDSSNLAYRTLRSSMFRISSTHYYGSTQIDFKVGMFFNIGTEGRSDVSIGYAYIDITYPGPGQQSTYDVYVLVADGTYQRLLAPNRKLTQRPLYVVQGSNPANPSPTAPNRINPNHVLVTDYYPTVVGELIATRMYDSSEALCCDEGGSWKSEIQFFEFEVDRHSGELLSSSIPLPRDGDSVSDSSTPDFCNPRTDYFGVYYPMVVPPETWMTGPDYMFVNVDDTCDHEEWGPFKIRLLEYSP